MTTAAPANTATAPWIARQTAELLPRPGHAWLLQGPAGLGQFDLALALVQAWLCDQPTESGACGHCPCCHGVRVHTHADLLVLMPETELLARGWPLPEHAQAEIDAKKRKPSREIRVDALRQAIDFAQRTSARGHGKAVLIHPAERMNAIAANALLKTLEEPAGDTRFALASDAAHLLLPTIRSRCLTHTMHWPQAGEALAWLTQSGLSADAAQALLRASGQRPAQALAMAQATESPAARKGAANIAQQASECASRWAALPRAMQNGDASALAGVPLPQAIEQLQKLCHDLAALHTGSAPRYFNAADLPRQPPPLAALLRWWQQLAAAARTAEHPWKADLAAESLTASAQQALNSALNSGR